MLNWAIQHIVPKRVRPIMTSRVSAGLRRDRGGAAWAGGTDHQSVYRIPQMPEYIGQYGHAPDPCPHIVRVATENGNAAWPGGAGRKNRAGWDNILPPAVRRPHIFDP